MQTWSNRRGIVSILSNANKELPRYIGHHNILRDGMIEAGRLEAARELFSHIFITGLKPSLPTYNKMIKGLCDEGLPEKAYDLLRKMEEDDCFPNNISYNITIRGFLQSNDLSKAMKILHEMENKGFSADASTAIMVVDLLSINEDNQPTYEMHLQQRKRVKFQVVSFQLTACHHICMDSVLYII
ncbi:hypothetical protein REPUB_Repub18cG0165400 [Reevesia pubescens]